MKRTMSLSVALALVVCAACTTSTEGSPTDTASAPPPSSGTIVFNRVDPTGIAVYSLDLGTATENKIREVEDFVTLSPDGRRFVDTTLEQDGTGTPTTFDIDGSGYAVVKLADPTFEMVVGSGGWSPDGKRFFGGGGDATDPSREGLYTVRIADGDGLVRLTDPGAPPSDYAVGYSPDGSHVLFIREVKPYDHSGPMDVFVVGTDGEGLVRLNPPGTTSGLDGQSWSPDGRQVAFVAAKGSFWDDDRAVFVADADGTNARRITPWNVTFRAEWSPDGEWIAYDFDPSGYGVDPHDLYVVHPDGTERTQITSNEDGKMSFAPVWSPDSRSLLFVRRELDDEPDLWTVNVDGSGLSQVTHEPAEYSGYRWLPRTGPISPSVRVLAATNCPDFSCGGPLEPGRYRATYYDPTIEFEISSPGWAWTYTGNFVIETDTAPTPYSSDGIYFLLDPAIASQDCTDAAEPGVGRSVDDLVAWLDAAPGLAVSEPTPVSLGGLDGMQVDLQMDPGWKKTCFYSDGLPVVPLVFSGADIGGYNWPIGSDQWMRWYVLDSDQGVIIVDIENNPGGLSRDDLLLTGSEIVDSLVFSR